MFNILIVEDDERLNKLIRTVLTNEGYRACGVLDPLAAFDKMDEEVFDLIISDIMMPKMDGFEFAKMIRNSNQEIPILFITAKDSFADKQRGFTIGVDDYMVKPIDINEMLLRVKALLRRAKIASEHVLVVGNTTLEYDSLTVKNNDSEIILPQKEFYILFKLLSFPNKIFTRGQLMDEFWGMYSDSNERTVDVHMTRLREKFKDNKDFEIVTVRGLGYKAIKK